MTIPLNISKADLIAAIGRALVSEERTEEAAAFYEKTLTARDVQEVMSLRPDDLPVEWGT